MSSGLFALLDDVAALAKVAAASIDDVMAHAAKAGTKAAGVVIDDAAVTPRYAVGFAAERELPIVWKIARGSFKNKLIFLLPGALLLSLVAPWLITPLLMLGGVYLCYEGAEKIVGLILPHAAAQGAGASGLSAADAKELEAKTIAGAIKTDFILSAEIMAISLAGVATLSFAEQAFILAIVGIGITVAVYGAVALIVKADDVGVAMARSERPLSGLFNWLLRRGQQAVAAAPGLADRVLRPLTQAIGRGLVIGMPYFLTLLGGVGTAAMLWVGGGILVHGLEGYGFGWLGHLFQDLGIAGGQAVPGFSGAVSWLIGAALAAVTGLVVGAIAIVAMHYAVQPLLRSFRPATS